MNAKPCDISSTMRNPASNAYTPNFKSVENTRFSKVGFGYGERPAL